MRAHSRQRFRVRSCRSRRTSSLANCLRMRFKRRACLRRSASSFISRISRIFIVPRSAVARSVPVQRMPRTAALSLNALIATVADPGRGRSIPAAVYSRSRDSYDGGKSCVIRVYTELYR